MDDRDLDEAMAEAHLPALLAAMVQLTGDPGWLKPEWAPGYTPPTRNDTRIPQAEQARIRAAAKAAIKAHQGAPAKLPTPDGPLVRRMMDFVAGCPIPEGYADFVLDELALKGSTKDPDFEQPALKAAARKLKVLVIGAGMSGLLTGIRLRQAGVPFEIVEKNADVGGTWFENSYPGCRVDNPNHMYSYSFEPSHAWPQHYSPQPVLLQYFRGVAAKYDIRKDIRFETTVEVLTWDEGRSVWRCELVGKDGPRETIEANVVVSAVGQLNQPRLPDIEGRELFEGPAFHSAEWRHDIDLAGKRVAVIGTGASAYQFVPEIAPKVAKLSIFQRTPPWGMPSLNYHHDVAAGKKWVLEHVPFYDKWYRFFLFWMNTEGFMPMVKNDPGWNGPPTAVGEANLGLRETVAAALAAQVTDRPELLPHVVPTYPIGGKRVVLDNGVWIGALKRPNVALVPDEIVRITPKGLVTADGALHEVDVIVYGTGFQASNFLSTLKVTGRGGQELHEVWAGEPRAYLGMTAPGFPNFFMLYGPNTNLVVNGSIIFFSECAVRYIVECLKLLAETGARSMEVKRAVHDAFNVRVDEANAKWAWGSPGLRSWYKNASGRVTQNWPFELIDYWRATLAPNPDDFVLQRQAEPVA
jgi:4-hydroxyacetophenone monooxygenase